MNKIEDFAHDLCNKATALEGKIKKLKKETKDNQEISFLIQSLEKSSQENIGILQKFREYIQEMNNKKIA